MEQSNASLKTLTLIFAGIFLAVSFVAILLIVALEMFFQFSMDSSAMGFFAPMVAAMQVGTMYFNRTGQRPQSGFAWKAGFSFALTAILISLLILVTTYSFGIYPELEAILREPGFMPVLIGILLVITLLLVVVCRFAFGFGARQGQKLKAKMQSKG